jgi:hypothetical protein
VGRLPGWVLLAYLLMDLGTPLVPGVFRFSLEDGVVWMEAVSDRRAAGVTPTASTAAPLSAMAPAAPSAAPRRVWRPPGRALLGFLTDVRSGDPPARDLPSTSTDDH